MTDLAIRKILESDNALAAIVGAKVYLSYIPQGQEAPLVLCNTVSIDRGLTKDDDQREELLIDVVSVSDTLKGCKDIDIAVFSLLHHYDGDAVALSSGEAIKITHSYLVTTRGEYNTEIGYHTIVSTYRVMSDVTL